MSTKIDKALNLAIEAESKIKKRNSNIIEPLKKTCEKFQEKKELNKIFLKELSFFNILKYPKNLKKVMLKKILLKNVELKEDIEGICRSAIITLFLNDRDSLNKYIRTNYYLTTKNESCIKEGLKISETIVKILKNKSIKKIENKNNLTIENFYLKYKEVDTVIFILNKYRKDYNNGLLELKKLKNENMLFIYGLLYGLLY
jgi:hypothetical protein